MSFAVWLKTYIWVCFLEVLKVCISHFLQVYIKTSLLQVDCRHIHFSFLIGYFDLLQTIPLGLKFTLNNAKVHIHLNYVVLSTGISHKISVLLTLFLWHTMNIFQHMMFSKLCPRISLINVSDWGLGFCFLNGSQEENMY